ncbi:MAG: hypothetical protein SGJ18_04030 [Pseudomonadota bacterium]|nr:hypothetical protein [Pseudomonadota bacterium]
MTFKVATFNIWHGLNGDSSINMESLEPKGRKFLRLNYQRDILRDLAVDLVFLQEVNPCPRLSKELAEHLNLDEVHQIDNAGIKLLGFGFPKKLFGGITILAQRNLGLKHVESVKLSGPRFSFCNEFLSLQLHEHRYCLIVEVSHPSFGRILCANVHLHHGLELSLSLVKNINSLREANLISQSDYDQIMAIGRAAQERRFHEIKTMAEAFKRIQAAQKYQGLILAGDLNCSEESQEWQNIIDLGFSDNNIKLNGPNTNFTWNTQENKVNHDLGKNFHFPWFLNKKFTDLAARDNLRLALMDNEFRKRRIDYIFSKGDIDKALVSSILFADRPNKNELVASDHFGVVSEFKF